MSTSGVVVLAMVFGLVVGISFTLLIRAAIDRGAAALDVQASALPDGAAAVVAALVEPAMVLDGSNTVLEVTEGAVQLGLVADRGIAHPELERLVDEVRGGHEARRREVALPRTPGGLRTLHVAAHAAPIDLSRVLLVVEDRSDALRLEAMRRDFVANVSHELKTPIGAVSLLAEALDTAADDPDRVRRFAARLTTESARLGALVREILEFSHLQDRDPLDGADLVALDDVLAVAADRTRTAAEAGAVSLVLGKRSGLRTRGDAEQLTTAVQNLVTNAIAFSPPRSHVGVGVRAREEMVEIAVSDQGPGIADEDLDRVFERFYRTDQARSRSTGGTGLGLSIVKHIAENHGGEVGVWSKPGRGSTFTIRLPRAAAEPTRSKRREKERT